MTAMFTIKHYIPAILNSLCMYALSVLVCVQLSLHFSLGEEVSHFKMIWPDMAAHICRYVQPRGFWVRRQLQF